MIPDAMRALATGTTLEIRNPSFVRPWQHVLEPLYGYLILARRLYENGVVYGEAWNFGPEESSEQPVSIVIDRLKKHLGGKLRTNVAPQPPVFVPPQS